MLAFDLSKLREIDFGPVRNLQTWTMEGDVITICDDIFKQAAEDGFALCS